MYFGVQTDTFNLLTGSLNSALKLIKKKTFNLYKSA